jgi:hypothetical protein
MGMQRPRASYGIALVLACSIAVGACGGDGAGTPQTTAPGEATTTMPERDDRPPTSLPDAVPPDAVSPPTVTGEVPAALLEPVVAEAAELAGVAPEDVVVVTGQEMVWSDGSLGCPEPGQVYTQAEVPGYWVVVEAGGAAYDYRLTAGGFFRLCTSPSPVPGGSSPTS